MQHLKLITDAWKKAQDAVEPVSIRVMQEINGKVTPRKCRRLEELEEGHI